MGRITIILTGEISDEETAQTLVNNLSNSELITTNNLNMNCVYNSKLEVQII